MTRHSEHLPPHGSAILAGVLAAALAVVTFGSPSAAITESKKKAHHPKPQLPAGHYTGQLDGAIPFTMSPGNPSTAGFGGSGRATFSGTIDLNARDKNVNGNSTFAMHFEYKLQLPPGLPVVAGSDVKADASGALEIPATLGADLTKHGFDAGGDVKGAGGFNATVTGQQGENARAGDTAQGKDHVEIEFKATSVTCTDAVGRFKGKFIDNLVSGMEKAGWQVMLDPKQLTWSVKADDLSARKHDQHRRIVKKKAADIPAKPKKAAQQAFDKLQHEIETSSKFDDSERWCLLQDAVTSAPDTATS